MVNCCVLGCQSYSEAKIANITFHRFPKLDTVRQLWIRATRRHNWKPTELARMCSRHFEENCFRRIGSKTLLNPSSIPTRHILPNDMANYMEYHLMGSVSQIRMNPGCMPRKFSCQQDRQKRTCNATVRPCYLKRQRKKMIEECVYDLDERSLKKEQMEHGDISPDEATSSLQAPDDTASSWQWEETDAVNLQPAEQSQASGTGPPVEENFCDACNTGFTGFLYLCGQCDYQMCTSCDYAGAHKDHYVLRVPAHSPKAEVDEVLGKFRATLDAMTLKRPPPNRRKKKKRKELAPAPAPGSETEDADEGDARATETPVDVVVKMEVEVEEHDPLDAARVKREPAAPEAPAAADSFTEMEEVTIKMEPIDEVECPSTSQFPSIHLGDPRAPNDHCESTDPRAPNDPCESTDPSDVQKVPTASGPLKRGMKQTSAPNISKKPRGKKSKAVT